MRLDVTNIKFNLSCVKSTLTHVRSDLINVNDKLDLTKSR